MKFSDIAAMMAEIAPVIREYTAASLAPVFEQIKAINQRIDAVSADIDAGAMEALAKDTASLTAAVEALQSAGPPQIDYAEISKRVLADIPQPVSVAESLVDRDGNLVMTFTDGRCRNVGPVVGKSVDEREIMQRLCAQTGDMIEALKADIDAAADRVAKLQMPDFAKMLADAVKALPKPATVSEMESMVKAEVSTAFEKMPKPKDGADGRGLASMLVDRDGELVATMTDGRTEKLGRVVGRDGADADMGAIERAIAESVKALPKPKDGADGLGFDEFELEDTEDGYVMRFARGDTIKRYPVAIPRDCGIYVAGKSYAKGSAVTWAGSYWIASKSTAAKPGADDDWRLAVKKGRDGKDMKQ